MRLRFCCQNLLKAFCEDRLQMNNSSTSVFRQRPSSAATETLGVHILTQFIYCPLAGVAQYEDRLADRYDGQIPRKDYLPEYDLQEIEQKLKEYVQQIKIVLWMALAFTVLSLVLSCVATAWYLLILLLGWCFIFKVGRDKVRKALTLHRRRNEYLRTHRQSLPNPLLEDTVVQWWGLIKSGFDLTPGVDLFDQELKLSGTPFRILRKGGLAIPVFYYRGSATKVRYRDRARIAAYCRMLVKNEGCVSPYGILLRTGSYTADAIPNDERAQGILRKELPKARQVLAESLENPDLVKPDNFTNCKSCRTGEPHSYDPRKEPHFRYDEPLRRKLHSCRGQSYHSHCGDRFDWTPPHEKAVRLGWVSDPMQEDY